MKASKKVIIIAIAALVLLIGGGVVYATNNPTARAERQLNLGNKYLEEGKYQEAILAYEKVGQIDPKNIPARLGLGNAYIATKEYGKAETVLKEVIELDPNNLPAREKLANVFIQSAKLDLADEVLKEISTIEPQKDVSQLTSDLDLAKILSTSKANYDQGIKQMSDNQYLEAIASLQKVVPEDTERYSDALSKSSECKKIFIDTTLQKVKEAATNKNYQTALDLIDQVLKVDTNNQEALNLKNDYTAANKAKVDNSTANNGSTVYENKNSGFSINIPKSWEGKYVLEEKHFQEDGRPKSDLFTFKYKGKEGNDMFTGIYIIYGTANNIDEVDKARLLGTKDNKFYMRDYANNTRYEGEEYEDFMKMLKESDSMFKTFIKIL